MTKRGRKLHQTMARRYAIARGENPDANSQWNVSDLQRAVAIAWKAYDEWCAKAVVAVQHFLEVIEPWYQANREAIEAAIQSNPASVQRQLLEMSFADGQQNSDLPRAHTEPGGHDALIEPRA